MIWEEKNTDVKLYLIGRYGKSRCATAKLLEDNVQKAIEAGRSLLLKGHLVYIPHLMHFVADGWEDAPSENSFLLMVAKWIQHCDGVVIVGDVRGSLGSSFELGIAQVLGKAIYYSVDEVPDERNRKLIE
jgi:nucleoside 2-deoxyribosyltransferase